MTLDQENTLITLRDRAQIRESFDAIREEDKKSETEIDVLPGFRAFLNSFLRIAGRTYTTERLIESIRRRVYRLAAPQEPGLAMAIFIGGKNPIAAEAEILGIQIPEGANIVEGLTQFTIFGLVSKRPFIEALVDEPEHVRLIKESLAKPIPPGTFPSLYS